MSQVSQLDVVLGEESESQLSSEPPGSDEVRLSQPRAGRRAWAVSDTRTGGIRDMVTIMVIIMVMVTIMVTIMVMVTIMIIIMVIIMNMTQ